MRHAQLISTRVTDRGIWAIVRITVGQVTTDRKVLLGWADIELGDVTEHLDRQARRMLLEAWSEEPLPLWE